MHICHKQIHFWGVFIWNCCFWTKYQSIVHNNTSSSEKAHLLLFPHIKIYRYICLETFWTVLACKRCLSCAYFSPDSDEITFSLEKEILWIEESYFSKAFKHLNDGFIKNTCFCGLLWCFYQLFGHSFWRHPFTTEDPLLSKWYYATFLQICLDVRFGYPVGE